MQENMPLAQQGSQIPQNSAETTVSAPTNEPVLGLDLQDLLASGHYSEVRGGLIYIVNATTGATKAIIPRSWDTATSLVPHILPTGVTVYSPEGVPPITPQVREVLHNPLVVDLICQRISEGASLTQVCKEPGMPTYNTLMKWRRHHDYIDKALHEARVDRAEGLRDKAVEEAEQAQSRDPVAASALRVDTYKWAAGVDNPRYSPKAKVEATITAPTQIVVNTGIDRSPHSTPSTGVSE